MTPARLLLLACALVLWAGAPAAVWGGPAAAKVFPLTPARELPAALDDAPDRLTGVVAKLAGAEVSDDAIKDVAAAARCSIDDSTCLDRIARAGRVKELVFGTVRVGDDQRVFVKLTRYIAGTERREKTFVLTASTPAALARQLSRAAREMFELPPLDDESDAKVGAARDPDAEPERPRRRPARTEGGEGPGGEPGQARDPDGEPSQRPRRRAARIRTTTGTVLLVAGGLATAGGVVRALLQRRPIDAGADRAVSLVPIAGGAALVLSGRLP